MGTQVWGGVKLEGFTRGKPGTSAQQPITMSRTIDNNNVPLAVYILPIFTKGGKGDTESINLKNQANVAIEHFGKKPATYENCQQLQRYLQETLAETMMTTKTPHRDEVIDQLTDRIVTLQSAVERHQKLVNPEYKPQTELDYWRGLMERIDGRAKVLSAYWAGTGRKPNKDPNTLEGYLWSIPGIDRMGIVTLLNEHIDQIMKFVPSNKEEQDDIKDGATKYEKRIVFEVSNVLGWIRWSARHQKQDDLYIYVQELGMESPVETVEAI